MEGCQTANMMEQFRENSYWGLEEKSNSIIERWKIDAESYKNGAKVLVSVPQCETCINYIEGNALHCKRYDDEEKPKYVMFPQKECPSYNNKKR